MYSLIEDILAYFNVSKRTRALVERKAIELLIGKKLINKMLGE